MRLPGSVGTAECDDGAIDDDSILLILRLRPARDKARALAVAEATALLGDLGARAGSGGPFSEERGVGWVTIPRAAYDEAVERFSRLGYTVAVDRLTTDPQASATTVRWRRRQWGVDRIYEEDEDQTRDLAVDRRRFLLRTPDGVREVRGYRGDGSALARRGLAVADARLLANLAAPRPGSVALDPFAGVGGVVLELQRSGATVLSADLDVTVAPGLAEMTNGRHVVASADRLPFPVGRLDAVATETPFDDIADTVVVAAVEALLESLRPGGRLAVMLSPGQADGVVAATTSRSNLLLDEDVDRKGLAVRVLVLEST